MLSERYEPQTLRLTSKADWHPYPTSGERGFWQSLPPAMRNAYVTRGETALDYSWPSLVATRLLEVARTGNRYNYQQAYFERRKTLLDLVLAECMEGTGRFVDAIVDGVWLLCEESFWGLPAHLTMQRAGRGLPDTTEPVVDLFAAETAGLLAYALHLVGARLDGVSALIRPRIEREIDRRILTPCRERDDFAWMGLADPGQRPNNWNPWINSNWLACLLLIEPDELRRRESAAKIMRSLDAFIDPYPADGGCDEGPGYWRRAAASLFECLELLHAATDGQVDVFAEPLIKEMARFIYRMQISQDYIVNFADASALIQPDPGVIFRYGQRIGDQDMIAMGAWAARRQNLFVSPIHETTDGNRPNPSAGRELQLVASLGDIAATSGYPPLPRDTWLPVIEVMTARDKARSAEGFYVAAKAGHNAEMHNHNDVGQFIVFMDGLPVLIDVGVETYSAKTFSPQRYDIWTMQSGYHNLPTVNGRMQSPGKQFAARDVDYRADDSQAELRLDIAAAYPPEAGLNRWHRTVRLRRGQGIDIEDDFELDAPPASLSMNLLTPCTVDVSMPGLLRFGSRQLAGERRSGRASLHYNADRLSASVETIRLDDALLREVWGETLCRVVFTAAAPAQKDSWTLRITR